MNTCYTGIGHSVMSVMAVREMLNMFVWLTRERFRSWLSRRAVSYERRRYVSSSGCSLTDSSLPELVTSRRNSITSNTAKYASILLMICVGLGSLEL